MTTRDALVERITARYADAGLHFGHGTENARDEAFWTVCSCLGITPDPDTWRGDLSLAHSEERACLELATRRIQERQPLAYLINEAWFAGEAYYVDERVLVPRSHLGDWIPDRFEPWISSDDVSSILDIGTGSGCIAIALAKAFDDCRVVGTDISEAALDVARHNATRHGVEDRIEWLLADIYDGSRGHFDLIVSNPPYVDDATMAALPPEYDPEPDVAFRGGLDGLDSIHRIISVADSWLSERGHLAIEVATARAAFERAYPENTLLWLATESDEEALLLASRADVTTLAHG